MTDFDNDTIFDFSPLASFQSVGDGAVILLTDSGQLFSCNETTESFLRKVDGTRNLDAIVSLMAEEYDADRDTLAVRSGSEVESQV